MKKYTILLMMILLSSIAVSAADFEFTVTPIRDQIDSGETAQFLITIDNQLSTIKEFKIYSPDVEWGVPTEVVKAYPNTETSHKLVITPSKYIEPGKIYGIKLNIKDVATDEIAYTAIAQVNVKSSMKAISAYRPSVRLVADLPANINPKEPVTVKVRLENQNLLNLSDLTLKVTSTIEAFETEEAIELIPLGKKVVELNYELDPFQEPGNYALTFSILKDGDVVESTTKTAEISSINPPFTEEETVGGFLFRTVIIKTFTSSSNSEDTQEVIIPTNFIKNVFTKTIPESEKITEEGKTYLSVPLSLRPGESKDVQVIVNYRLLVILLLLTVIVTYFYYKYKSPLTIRKGLSDVGIKEGGISELKVTLEITSAAKKTTKNVVVTDYIPNIADIEKEFAEGTLKPTRIFKHGRKGTVVKWEIPEISAGEDRLISYNIKSKLSIVGDFKMPRAKVSFKKKGKELTSYSNSAEVSS